MTDQGDHCYDEAVPLHKVRPRSAAPVEKQKISASVFEQLVSFVVNGHWAVGQRIPAERDLCAQLGIARTSLREALKALELIGMVESRVGDGTFVCPRSKFLARPLQWAFAGSNQEHMQEVIEARIFLETSLAGLAAERATREEVERIGAAVDSMREDVTAARPCGDSEMAFHQAIAGAAHNHVLTGAMQLLLNQMRTWIYREMRPASGRLKRHEAIYRAIAAKDADTARMQTWQHGVETVSAIATFLERGSDAPRKRGTA